MPERARMEELDRALDALLASGAPPEHSSAELAPLLRIGDALRELPREEFRTRLRMELERRIAMSQSAAQPAPRRLATVTPYLVVEKPAEYLAFLKTAFAAEELHVTTGSQGGVHAELRIGDSVLMTGGGAGAAPMPSAIHLYVPDADAVYRRALAAGAASFYEPMDQPYGDREAGVVDPAGNNWYIATHRGAHFAREGFRSITLTLHPRGTAQLIELLLNVFDAQAGECHTAAEGMVLHAEVRLGDSVIELGEARGPIAPMAATVLLYVENVDARYARALQAGCTSLEAPADQPYGDRRAGVQDPFGNKWYLSAPLRAAKS